MYRFVNSAIVNNYNVLQGKRFEMCTWVVKYTNVIIIILEALAICH